MPMPAPMAAMPAPIPAPIFAIGAKSLATCSKIVSNDMVFVFMVNNNYRDRVTNVPVNFF
jgi:hypothetical protein